MEPFRPTYAEIDLSCISGNIREIKRVLSPKTKFMAIVKANAYGHGAVEIAKTAGSAGADYLGVASLGEALELRSASVNLPILVLSETPHAFAERVIDAGISQTVYTSELAQVLSDTARQKGRDVKVHVKIDTGMGRVGVMPDKAVALVKKIASLPNIFLEGVFTHFAKADDPGSDMTLMQFEKFRGLLQEIRSHGINVPIKHCANSAAMLCFPRTHMDMVRIGICMYGLYPSDAARDKVHLRPALSFRTKVLYIKEVPAGTPLSYGATYLTPASTRIATLPVGYADGLSRGVSNKGSVLIRGKRYPVVGRVTMDMILVDAGRDRIEVGDDAVIIGEQGRERITADDVAMMDETINYEVVCGIGKRVPRVYVKQGC